MNNQSGQLVEDPNLERLDDQARAQDTLMAEMGLTASRAGTEVEDDTAPYDLEPEAPRVLSLERLLSLSEVPLPPEISAATGEYCAVVVLHGLTPFHRRGHRPSEIWGMGYESVPVDCDAARTVSYEPGNRVVKAIEVVQTMAVDVALDGSMAAGVPSDAAIPVAAGLAGAASTRLGFALSLQIEWSVVEVQAGPVGHGGVRWNLYRQGSRIDRHHRLIQTMLLPRSTKELNVEVRTWVRRRGLFGVFGTREWQSPVRRFTLAVEDARH